MRWRNRRERVKNLQDFPEMIIRSGCRSRDVPRTETASVDANCGIGNGACCRLIENAGKVDSTPPPINPYIEPERENPRSLRYWCRVVYGIPCRVQIPARMIKYGTVAQQEDAIASKTMYCGFKSRPCHQFSVDAQSWTQVSAGTVGWVLGSPERSPSSPDVVIAVRSLPKAGTLNELAARKDGHYKLAWRNGSASVL